MGVNVNADSFPIPINKQASPFIQQAVLDKEMSFVYTILGRFCYFGSHATLLGDAV